MKPTDDVLARLPESLGLTALRLDLPNLEVHAAAAGPESGDLVVLLHGFPESWYSWRHQIPALAAAGLFVVAPDQRGYGLSGKAPPYDAATLARDVVDLIHALGRERAHLVGHDWGAVVAWTVATDYPDVVDRLAVLNVPHPAELGRALRGGDWRQLLKSWYTLFFQLPALPERLLSAADYRAMRRAMLVSARPETFSESDLAIYRAAWAQPGALTAMLGWYRAALQPGRQSGRAYRRIDAPGLILWGERDVALRVELAEASLRWLARGRLVRYPEATHWVHEDLPGEVNREIIAHLKGSDETGASGVGRRALVLGAGIAGLLAARVLSDHFEQVTVVERDRLPDSPANRPGVPQGQHLHGLLLRGKLILEGFFPGLQAELAEAGAPYVDFMRDVAALTPHGWVVRFPSPLNGRSASRALLEWTVRKRVASIANVAFVEESVIQGLVGEGDRVVGVRIAARGTRGGERDQQVLRADLVVDATGRGSNLPTWLRELGYPTPDETIVDSRLGYATRVYRIPDSPPSDWRGLFIQVVPHGLVRGGVLQPVEGGRWMVTVGGAGGDYPPTDPVGFLEFTRSLASPAIYEAIREAEPLSVVYGSRSTVNVLRHYERLSRFPDGLVALGDAVCAFNPIYGQGMTTAALGAEILDECLREKRSPGGLPGNESLEGLSKRFQSRLARSNRSAWDTATGEDLKVPSARRSGLQRRRPHLAAGLVRLYTARVAALAAEDPFVRLTFNEVISLVRPPVELFHPRMLTRVLFGPVGGRLGRVTREALNGQGSAAG